MVQTGYERVLAADVREGDVYKFTGVDGRVSIGEVVAVEGRLVQVSWWDRSRPMTWTYRDVPRVTFGRPV